MIGLPKIPDHFPEPVLMISMIGSTYDTILLIAISASNSMASAVGNGRVYIVSNSSWSCGITTL